MIRGYSAIAVKDNVLVMKFERSAKDSLNPNL